MKKLTFLISWVLCLLIGDVKAQEEFFVTVNPATGTDSIISSLPGVNYINTEGGSTFDKKNHRYIFKGKDFNGYVRLYCVNALTGAILSQPIDTNFNVGYLEYDYTNDSLYALYEDDYNYITYLVSIDIATDAIHFVTAFPSSVFGFGANSPVVFDQINQTYVALGYSINVTTGNITASPIAPIQPEFDNTTSNTYGLQPFPHYMLLVNFDVATGKYIIVDTLPTIQYSTDQTAFDEINHVYTFSNNNYLYSLDVNSGKVISGPRFPVGMTAPQNVIELQYDNSNGILYALHWGTTDAGVNNISANSGAINLYPNPSNGIFTIALSHPELVSGSQTIAVYNVLGEQVLTETLRAAQGDKVINLTGQPSGIYLYRVLGNGGELTGQGKLVLQK